MSDNRKYYYLKLKENYFDDDSIVLLESMQDGVLYSNILLKLYLKSLKHGGRLQLDEDIPKPSDSTTSTTSWRRTRTKTPSLKAGATSSTTSMPVSVFSCRSSTIRAI